MEKTETTKAESKDRYRLVIGFARSDEEEMPNIKDFNTALNEAVADLYMPVFQTLRVTRVEGNIMFTIITERRDEPQFIGGQGEL